eukprot:COSAG01_NODE_14667_length_1423_cov_4.092145_2_plen_210_part_00
MLGAVLEGFPPGSPGAKRLGGVYRVCGEHAGLPRFQGAEAHNGAAHMYRYRGGGADRWYVHTEFAPKKNVGAAQVNPLPGGAVPEHGRAGVKWEAWSDWLGLPQKDGKQHSVPDQPLVLTALVRSPPPHSLTPLRCARPVHPPLHSPSLRFARLVVVVVVVVVLTVPNPESGAVRVPRAAAAAAARSTRRRRWSSRSRRRSRGPQLWHS